MCQWLRPAAAARQSTTLAKGAGVVRATAIAAFVALAGGPTSAQANLVLNGDFEAGNTGFTSGYAYSPGSNGTEGQYTVRSTPAGWNGSFVDIPQLTLQLLNQNTTRGGNDFALDDIFLDTRTSAVVPEPSTLALLGLGLAALFIGRTRSQRA